METIILGLGLLTPLYPQQSIQTEPSTQHNQQRAVIEKLTKECNFNILGSEFSSGWFLTQLQRPLL